MSRTHHERFLIRPGITGIWQVSGRSSLSMTQALEIDVQYVRSRSLALNLAILVLTVPAVLSWQHAQ
jgi:lipopolysaccharide/colanic/teichoic acid biosynthesis glycosyltransferase